MHKVAGMRSLRCVIEKEKYIDNIKRKLSKLKWFTTTTCFCQQ